MIWSNKAGFFSVDQMSEAAVLLVSMESWLKGRTFPKLGLFTLKDCSHPTAFEELSCSIAQ